MKHQNLNIILNKLFKLFKLFKKVLSKTNNLKYKFDTNIIYNK